MDFDVKIAEMTPEYVRGQVEAIRAESDDPEAAHSDEDFLFGCVLQATAEGHPQAAEMAAEALKTLDIYFPRWCT